MGPGKTRRQQSHPKRGRREALASLNGSGVGDQRGRGSNGSKAIGDNLVLRMLKRVRGNRVARADITLVVIDAAVTGRELWDRAVLGDERAFAVYNRYA